MSAVYIEATRYPKIKAVMGAYDQDCIITRGENELYLQSGPDYFWKFVNGFHISAEDKEWVPVFESNFKIFDQDGIKYVGPRLLVSSNRRVVHDVKFNFGEKNRYQDLSFTYLVPGMLGLLRSAIPLPWWSDILSYQRQLKDYLSEVSNDEPKSIVKIKGSGRGNVKFIYSR